LKNDNKARRDAHLAECRAEAQKTKEDIEEVQAAKQAAREKVIADHAAWKAANPGGAKVISLHSLLSVFLPHYSPR